jgi:hypothetical protein
MEMGQHQLIVSTDELDQIVKSLMQSVTANTQKRRRLKEGTQQARTAAKDGDNLASSLQLAIKAQSESWTGE